MHKRVNFVLATAVVAVIVVTSVGAAPGKPKASPPSTASRADETAPGGSRHPAGAAATNRRPNREQAPP